MVRGGEQNECRTLESKRGERTQNTTRQMKSFAMRTTCSSLESMVREWATRVILFDFKERESRESISQTSMGMLSSSYSSRSFEHPPMLLSHSNSTFLDLPVFFWLQRCEANEGGGDLTKFT
eukprot:759179-Hanusia_phi.AAC.3